MPTFDIYRNLNAKSSDETWSVIDRTTGRVIDRVGQLAVADAALIVQPAGAAKVFATQTKKVHAFVRVKAEPWDDVLSNAVPEYPDSEWRATYRPKLGWDSFRYVEGPRKGQPVAFTEFALLDSGGRMYIR